ncbi:MAG: hypothetical protein KKA81_04175 [Bacteroidetes bacterium]|nr:hypothetical protein [Bacteroidota bacterium]
MKRYLLILSVFFFVGIGFAQQNATTDDGKKVVLNEDGTWDYVTENTGGIPGDCSTYIVTDSDKITGESSTSTIRKIVVSKDGGETGLIFYGFLSEGKLTITMEVYGASLCMQPGSHINILFRDGSKLDLQNNNKYNCENKGAMFFGDSWGKKKELQLLMKKEIETMRVYTADGFVQEDFTPENSRDLMETLKCFNELL